LIAVWKKRWIQMRIDPPRLSTWIGRPNWRCRLWRIPSGATIANGTKIAAVTATTPPANAAAVRGPRVRQRWRRRTGAIAAGHSFAPIPAPSRIAATASRSRRNAASASTASAVGQ